MSSSEGCGVSLLLQRHSSIPASCLLLTLGAPSKGRGIAHRWPPYCFWMKFMDCGCILSLALPPAKTSNCCLLFPNWIVSGTPAALITFAVMVPHTALSLVVGVSHHCISVLVSSCFLPSLPVGKVVIPWITLLYTCKLILIFFFLFMLCLCELMS